MIDRQFQRALLKNLYEHYPYHVKKDDYTNWYHDYYSNEETGDPITDGFNEAIDDMYTNRLKFNLFYLEGHGLIKFINKDTYINRGGPYKTLPIISITEKGIDFIQDDGGLSAILNIITVRFDADTIRQLIESGLAKADIPDDEKNSIRHKLKELPGKAMETVVTTLIQSVLTNPTTAMKMVGNALGINS